MTMIGPGDDYLIHQSFEPLRYVTTSDRRFFDRHMLSGHACSDELYLLMGLGAYPNLGVIDGFVSVAFKDRQITTRGSRELGVDRLDTSAVGPISLEIIEPGRRLRIVSAPDTDEGVSLDLSWQADVDLFDELPHFERHYGRVIQDGTRLVQTGRWSGTVDVAGRHYDVTPDTWWGARDRTWGVRSIGFEREPAGILQAKGVAADRAALWIWSPMQFEGGTVHFALGENAQGARTVSSVRRMPAIGQGPLEVLHEPDHELEFDADRTFRGGSVSWLEADGSRTSVTMTPLTQGWLRAGTGYGGPDPWRHGKYMGDGWSDSISFDLTDPAITSRLGPAHTLCHMESTRGETGYGLFETQVYGRYPRYGFEA